MGRWRWSRRLHHEELHLVAGPGYRNVICINRLNDEPMRTGLKISERVFGFCRVYWIVIVQNQLKVVRWWGQRIQFVTHRHGIFVGPRSRQWRKYL